MKHETTRFPWLFILLAYLLAWLFWIPVAITGTDYQSSPLLMLLVLAGVFGPGLAGMILNAVENEKAARKDFWQRMFDLRRLRPGWLLIILGLWPTLQLIAVGLARLFGGELPQYQFVKENTA